MQSCPSVHPSRMKQKPALVCYYQSYGSQSPKLILKRMLYDYD